MQDPDNEYVRLGRSDAYWLLRLATLWETSGLSHSDSTVHPGPVIRTRLKAVTEGIDKQPRTQGRPNGSAIKPPPEGYDAYVIHREFSDIGESPLAVRTTLAAAEEFVRIYNLNRTENLAVWTGYDVG